MNSSNSYSGHPIFHNRPPYTFYNKSFEDPTDALFLQLNEINPYFLNEVLQERQLSENRKEEEDEEEDEVIRDPRTQEEVICYVHDHTNNKCSLQLFNSPFDSCLSTKQHAAGLRVLQAWQSHTEVPPDDFRDWCKMAHQLQLERQRLQKFAQDYMHKHKVEMYKPAARLVKLYQQWYGKRVEQLLQQHPNDVAYNTNAGLPLVRLCKPLQDGLIGRVANIRPVAREGWLRVLPEEEGEEHWQEDCSILKLKMESFAAQCMQEKRYFDKQQIVQHFETMQQHEQQLSRRRFYLPLETLLFLLLAGEYVDLPTEVLLKIELAEDDTLSVYFEIPLPARNCGWHTHQQVVQRAHEAHLSLDTRTQWLQLKNDKVDLGCCADVEISAGLQAHAKDFKAQKFEAFLEQFASTKGKQMDEEAPYKTNEALIAWELETHLADSEAASGTIYQMLTSLQLPPATNTSALHVHGSCDIKLEYKSSFGCEVLTKYELLKHWWQLRFLETDNARQQPTQGICMRVCCATYETLLVERLTRAQVEQQLLEQYQLRMPQLLARLSEFLTLLSNMPAGEYLLRYNHKYSDKLLLCAPAREITLKTLYLHALLNVTPSDMCFMTDEAPYLPLAEQLVSRLQRIHGILPCTFPAASKTSKRALKKQEKRVYFNDRTQILQRVQLKTKALQKKINAKQKLRRKLAKMRRNKAKRNKKAQVSKEQEENERDRHADEILFADH